jgi:hypothetical protein
MPFCESLPLQINHLQPEKSSPQGRIREVGLDDNNKTWQETQKLPELFDGTINGFRRLCRGVAAISETSGDRFPVTSTLLPETHAFGPL